VRIGIITLPLHTNYGGILQAWALQTLLEKMGHEASHVFRHLHVTIPPYQGLSSADIAAIQRHTDAFIDRYIHGDERPVSAIGPHDFDAFVVGSDQIWRSLYAGGMCGGWKVGFLDFAADWDVRRVAYAPSFGLDRWEAPESDIPVCSALLKKFDAVSCRELSGSAICRDVLGVEAKTVVDPTMLLERADYSALVDAAETEPPKGDLMAYVLDRTQGPLSVLEKIVRTKGMTPFFANARPEDPSAPIAERIQPPLELWLRGFRDARMVVTDSFHATVFSVIFGRPFVVTGNPTRGLGRLESLLKQLGLEDHLVLSEDAFDPSKDYSVPSEAYARLVALRADGIHFLKEALT